MCGPKNMGNKNLASSQMEVAVKVVCGLPEEDVFGDKGGSIYGYSGEKDTMC